MKKFKLFFILTLIMVGVLPTFSESSAHFYGKKTSDTPSGAGYIYVYRGGGDGNFASYADGTPNRKDRIILPNDADWKSSDNQFDAGVCKLDDGNNAADGYKQLQNTNGGTNICALHMYYFAKPNPGYQFDGWYSDEAGANKLEGSVLHYPFPDTKYYSSLPRNAPSKPDEGSTANYYGNFNGSNYYNYTSSTKCNYISRWNDGTVGDTPPSSGIYDNKFHYLRNVELVSSGNDNIYRYAKFSIIPRTFTLAKTGYEAVTYTATGYSGNVSTSPQTTSELKTNISLSITIPDPEKYVFEGWYWSDGPSGAQTKISEDASTTFSWTGNSDIVALMNTVWIWPKVTRIVNNVAEVTYNSDTTEYKSWEEALAAAKAVSGATITLNKDVSNLAAVQTVDKSMTIDLNGHILAGTVNNLFTITGSGVVVTITDGSPQAAGRISLVNSTDAETYTVTVRSGAKLILDNGTIYSENSVSNGTARGVEAKSGTTIEVQGGHIEATSLQKAYALLNRGTATISGGDMYAHTTSGARSNAGTAVAFYNEGTTNTITGGTFRAYAHTYKAYGIQQNANNTLTINEATVRTETRGLWRNADDNGDDCISGNSYALFYSQGNIIVNGGRYYAINQGKDSKNRDAFYGVGSVNVADKAKVSLKGGVYLTHHNLAACAASGYTRCDLMATDPNYTAGYRYAIVSNTTEPYVCKVKTNTEVFYYKTLEEAFTYVNAHLTQTLTIVIIAPECTLSSGTYTVPSSTTLLLPYDVKETVSMEKAPYYYNSNAARTRECYSKLTLENGATLKVYGKLNVNAQLHNKAGGSMVATILDSYGRIHMNEGSHIDLENGSLCSVWGFITGDGTITAKSGSLVREAFQFDFRGGTHISNTYTTAFPMCQYYVQNIEAPITFNYGATENLFTCCYAQSADREGVASFIGSNGLFRLVSGSTLTRHYVGAEDRIYYDLYGNASIQDITVDVEIAEMASKSYILPINNNMTLRIHSGTTTIYYDLSLLPDSRVVIDEGATVEIKQNFYIYDKSDWRADETGYTYEDSNNKTQKSYFAVGADLNLLPFSPTKTFTRTSAGLTDAHVIVNGTLKTLSTKGKLYTTTHGSDITSEGSGKVILGVASGANTSFKQGISTASKTQAIPVTAAQLHNGNDTYIATSGAVSGDQFIYNQASGKWMKNPKTVMWDATTNGGSTDATTTIVGNGDALSTILSSMPEASKEHNTFNGWFTASTGGTEVTTATTVSANVTYYAQFTPDQYNIIYKDKDNADFSGVHGAGYPTHHAYGIATTLVNPTKAGYTFDGWFTTSACTGSAITSLGATAYTADITLYAKWTLNKYTVTIASNNTDYGTVDVASIENVPHGAAVSVSGNKITINGTTVTATATSSDAQYTYAFDNWEAPATIGDATTVTANFSRTTNTYTVTWKDEDGTTLKTDVNVPYGTTPTYDGAKPTKASDSEFAYTFNAWSPCVDAIVGNTEYTATYTATSLALVVSNEKEIEDDIELSTVTITTIGELNVEEGATLTTNNLILEASTAASGELTGNVVADNVYFDLILNNESNRRWNAFTVPFQVNLKESTGTRAIINGEALMLGRGYDIVYYDGAIRASEGKSANCWKYVEDGDSTLYPGQAYMIASASRAIERVRFTAELDNTGKPIGTTGLTVLAGEGSDGGWNGIGNPNMYHSILNAGPTVGYVHNGGKIGEDDYVEYNIENLKYVVGKAVYVQVYGSGTSPVQVSKANDQDVITPFLAPRRNAPAKTDKQYLSLEDYYKISISSDNGIMGSNVYVLGEEDKDDAYIIGHDLAKLNMSNVRAQMWIERYDNKLCMNTTALINNKAIYPLGLYIPQTGEYTISNQQSVAGGQTSDMLYLTYDGRVIWNLTYSPYTASLEKGTNIHYGLRLVHSNTPTDVEQIQTEGSSQQILKVLIDDKVYILRGGELYTITGQKAN